MQFSLIHIISIIAIFQSILLVLFLLGSKDRSNFSTIIFPVILILFAFISTSNLSVSLGLPFRYHRYVGIIHQFALLIGPLFYFYIKSLLVQQLKLTKKDFIHFIPFFVLFLFAVICYSILNISIWNRSIRTPLTIIYLIQTIAYIFLIINMLQKHGLSFKGLFPYMKDFKSAWIQFLIIVYIIFWLVHFHTFVLWAIFKMIRWCPYHFSLYALISFLFLNTIVYLSLKKPDIFQNQQKYIKSNLKPSSKRKYEQKLNEIMENDKLYLDPSLNLINLAKKLSIAPCHLSQIINESYDQSFRSFINHLRVQESKQYLAENSDNRMNILEIAYEVGFNSKSSFNAAFKKHVGMTPKEYKQKAMCQ